MSRVQCCTGILYQKLIYIHTGCNLHRLPEAKKTSVLVAIHRLAAGAIYTATDHLLVCYNKQWPSLLKIKETTDDLTTI